MNVGQLRKILVQYPMDCRVVLTVEKQTRLETTIRDLLFRFLAEDDREMMTVFGFPDLIIRERVDSRGGEAIIPQSKMWLEMDLR